MPCLDEDDVVALVEARLAPEPRAQAQLHLRSCDACRALVAHTARALLPTEHGDLDDGSPRSAPSVVGPYRVIERLGGGAMGVVYAAEHMKLRRRVALKIVRPDPGRAGDERQLRARLLREARAASAVRHPNVVTVHDVLELDDGSPVMVMDLLEGETLRTRLEREGRLAPRVAAGIMAQVLSALEAAHALGVVHRDLKPDNIFLTRDESEDGVKIVDFGIAKLTALDGPAAQTVGLTETGMLVGTPHYMAPEQAFADAALDARADLWAVGVILYECVTGRRPIEGDSIGQMLKRLARFDIVPLSRVAPDAPQPLIALVDSLLVEHDARPASAVRVRTALERWLATSTSSEARLSFTPVSSGGLVVDRGSWLAVRSPHTVRAGIFALVVAVVASALGAITREPPSAATASGVDAPAKPKPVVSRPALLDGPKRPHAEAPAPARKPVQRPARAKPVESAAPAAASAQREGPGKLLAEPPF